MENHLLNAESTKYKDLLFVDLVDHYRNLPKKLMQFYVWAFKFYRFKFSLKTDDDCYLNMPGILQALEEIKLEANKNVWFSRFRHNWQLDHFGKWAEVAYTSPVYPAFACGSGNVLSYNLVKWIANNHDALHFFQGEDISVGIWLSALAPLLLNDIRWSCFKSCHKELLSLPDNSPSELRRLYKNAALCHDPCSCS